MRMILLLTRPLSMYSLIASDTLSPNSLQQVGSSYKVMRSPKHMACCKPDVAKICALKRVVEVLIHHREDGMHSTKINL
jgi:hypothetical protein